MNDRQIRGENRDILCGDLFLKEKTGRTCIQIDRVIVMDLHCGTAHNRSFSFLLTYYKIKYIIYHIVYLKNNIIQCIV